MYDTIIADWKALFWLMQLVGFEGNQDDFQRSDLRNLERVRWDADITVKSGQCWSLTLFAWMRCTSTQVAFRGNIYPIGGLCGVCGIEFMIIHWSSPAEKKSTFSCKASDLSPKNSLACFLKVGQATKKGCCQKSHVWDIKWTWDPSLQDEWMRGLTREEEMRAYYSRIIIFAEE